MSDHLPECMTPDDPCADPESCDSLACARQRLHLTLRDEADQREGGHLPECRYYPQQSIVGDVGCICTALRACEQRVRQDMALQYLVSDREQQEAEQRAYAAGVAAARDAVAAADCWYATSAAVQVAGDDVKYVVRADALAVIDGLRSPLTTPVAPAAAIEGGPSNPLPPDSGLTPTGGALPIGGALGSGLSQIVGVASIATHARKTHQQPGSQHITDDFLAGLDAARDAVAFHEPVDYGKKYGVEHGEGRMVCDYCDNLNWSTEGLDQKDDIDWPCPTIAAIDALRGES